MRRYYARYVLWEDYQNGMYDKYLEPDKLALIDKAKSLLSDSAKFHAAIIELTQKWIVSTKVNMTNKHENRRAWLGWAACCYRYKVPEILTREAWRLLTDAERNSANFVADKFIKNYDLNYEKNNISIYNRLAVQGLF